MTTDFIIYLKKVTHVLKNLRFVFVEMSNFDNDLRSARDGSHDYTRDIIVLHIKMESNYKILPCREKSNSLFCSALTLQSLLDLDVLLVVSLCVLSNNPFKQEYHYA